MTKQRIKIQLPELRNRDEAEQMMNSLAASANARRQCVAKMDQRILALKKEYEAGIGVLDQTIEAKSTTLQAWAEANPAEFPQGRKSIEFLSGTLGFRTGMPKLSLLNRKWTWEKVLIEAMHLIPNFIRSKPELDKEAILNQRDEEAIQQAIALCGMKVDQSESFFIEPNLTN